jgi:multidrug resistance efflux pump
MKQTLRLSVLLIVAGLLITACSGAATPTPDTNQVPVVTDDFSVVAEGRLLPVEFTNLSFETGGKIAEVLVKEGATVAEGDVLARLESSEALQAQVAQAEADVLAAQQGLDDLNDNHEVALAQAQSAVATARKALDDADRKLKNLNFPDLEYYQDQIDDAEEALQTAQENVVVTDIGSLTAALQSARDFLKTAEERLGKIQAAINGCADCDPERSVTVDGYPQTLDDAQDSYNDAANRVRELEIQLAQSERGNTNAIDDAQEALDDAKEDLAFALNGPKALDLEIAQANVAVAQATLADAESTYAKLQDGPDPDQLAVLNARLNAARAGLVSAQDALKNSELHAPFDGVVADLKIKVGEQTAPGAPAAVLADFSKWIVETDNLTEIEVVKVAEGQNAEIVLDALPDVTLQGTVTAISPVFEEKRGDITYTVTVTLTNGDPAMRWGMTAVTTFAK